MKTKKILTQRRKGTKVKKEEKLTQRDKEGRNPEWLGTNVVRYCALDSSV
jgi:hypothetical protein